MNQQNVQRYLRQCSEKALAAFLIPLLALLLQACGGGASSPSPSSGAGNSNNSAPDRQPAAGLPPVQRTAPRHVGRHIVDEQGRVIVLHGINVINKQPPYLPDAQGFSADDIEFLVFNGFNNIRLGITWNGLEPNPGDYDFEYLNRIAAIAKQASEAGLMTLLDFHQDEFNERFQGNGFPDWAVMDDGLPAEPKRGHPENYYAMPALNRAFDNFWLNQTPPADTRPIWTAFAEAWATVVEKISNDGTVVLGYDLLNEPWPGNVWTSCANPAGCPAFDINMLAPMHATLLAAIREIDTETLVFYEPHLIFNTGVMSFHSNLNDPIYGPAQDCNSIY